MSSLQERFGNLPEEASRILFISNLPLFSNDDLYTFFGRFGKLRDLRLNVAAHENDPRCGFIIFEDVLDAVRAFEQLSDYIHLGQQFKVRYFVQTKPITEFDAVLNSLGK